MAAIMNKSSSILLIRPPEPNLDRQFSLGLGYIARALHNAGFVVETLCLDIFPMEDIGFISYLLERPYLRFFGIGGMYGSFPEFVRLCEMIRLVRPDSFIVLGGALPTSCPEFVLKKTKADVACIGPSEEAMVELMSLLVENEDIEGVAGIFIQKEGVIIRTPPREDLPKRLTKRGESSWPAWELFPAEHYFRLPTYYPFQPMDRVAPLLTARGCPYQCNFCFQPSPYSTRPVDDTLDEMEWLIKRWGATGFYIEDDLFMLDKKRVVLFCEGIIARGIKTRYTCTGRFNIVTPELVELLKASGCVTIFYGGESASQSTLDLMKKTITVDQMYEGIELSRRHGIFVRIGFMFGQPGETRKNLEQTVDFLKNISYGHFETRYIYGAIPFPGTELFHYCIREGLLTGDQDLLSRFEFKSRILDQLPVNMTAIQDTDPKMLLDAANYELSVHYAKRRSEWVIALQSC